jgi:Rrf2 family nitric oxide-sensitive transcriptional repressor
MTNIIHISEMTSIAVHSLTLIAARDNEMLNVKSIAQEIGASENHLSKVLQRLVKTGLLHSVRGPSGGFTLSKSAEEITLLGIYRLMEGYEPDNGCPSQRLACPFTRCIFGGILEKLNKEFEDYLAAHTLKDFADALKQNN